MTDNASATNTTPAIGNTSSCLVSSDDTERGAERQRADVTHEHHCRIGIEPQKAEAGADQRAAEDGHLADAVDVTSCR